MVVARARMGQMNGVEDRLGNPVVAARALGEGYRESGPKAVLRAGLRFRPADFGGQATDITAPGKIAGVDATGGTTVRFADAAVHDVDAARIGAHIGTGIIDRDGFAVASVGADVGGQATALILERFGIVDIEAGFDPFLDEPGDVFAGHVGLPVRLNAFASRVAGTAIRGDSEKCCAHTEKTEADCFAREHETSTAEDDTFRENDDSQTHSVTIHGSRVWRATEAWSS